MVMNEVVGEPEDICVGISDADVREAVAIEVEENGMALEGRAFELQRPSRTFESF